MILRSPSTWKDYELIDCGDYEKLERFGAYILIRPEPQAVWKKRMAAETWDNMAHARFVREKQKTSYRAGSQENGGWTIYKQMPDNWTITYPVDGRKITFKLALTSFGHIGVFPEQAENWEYITDQLSKFRNETPKVLNLFAYTGGASLIAKAAGADVTHLDAVKQVVSWSRENMELSKLHDIRWVIEDAMKYIKREVKRGKIYEGIILDPPAYGRGPDGEKWVLEDGLNELIEHASALLDKEKGFLVLNLYSMGFSSLIAHNVAESYFPNVEKEFGEFYLQATSGVKLPLGTFLRFNFGSK